MLAYSLPLKNAALPNEFPEASQTISLSDPYLIWSQDCPISVDQATLNYPHFHFLTIKV